MWTLDGSRMKLMTYRDRFKIRWIKIKINSIKNSL